MKKILFNDKFGLTKAVLDGRKTQTRRLLTLTLHKKADRGNALIEVSPSKVFFEDGKWKFVYDDYVFLLPKENYPKYRVGEVVVVAQSYEASWQENASAYHNPYFLRGLPGWKNKMFVAARDMPNQIRITAVRVERLQDISDECCLKEGIIKKWHAPACKNYYYVPGIEVKSVKDVHDTPQEAFANLINNVSRKDVWSENPYVFVYDFELVK